MPQLFAAIFEASRQQKRPQRWNEPQQRILANKNGRNDETNLNKEFGATLLRIGSWRISISTMSKLDDELIEKENCGLFCIYGKRTFS